MNINQKFCKFVQNHPPPKPTLIKKAPKKLAEGVQEEASSAVEGEKKEEVVEDEGQEGMSYDIDDKELEAVASAKKSLSDGWSIDVSAEAVEARKNAQLTGKMRELIGEESSATGNGNGNGVVDPLVSAFRQLNLDTTSGKRSFGESERTERWKCR